MSLVLMLISIVQVLHLVIVRIVVILLDFSARVESDWGRAWTGVFSLHCVNELQHFLIWKSDWRLLKVAVLLSMGVQQIFKTELQLIKFGFVEWDLFVLFSYFQLPLLALPLNTFQLFASCIVEFLFDGAHSLVIWLEIVSTRCYTFFTVDDR